MALAKNSAFGARLQYPGPTLDPGGRDESLASYPHQLALPESFPPRPSRNRPRGVLSKNGSVWHGEGLGHELTTKACDHQSKALSKPDPHLGRVPTRYTANLAVTTLEYLLYKTIAGRRESLHPPDDFETLNLPARFFLGFLRLLQYHPPMVSRSG